MPPQLEILAPFGQVKLAAERQSGAAAKSNLLAPRSAANATGPPPPLRFRDYVQLVATSGRAPDAQTGPHQFDLGSLERLQTRRLATLAQKLTSQRTRNPPPKLQPNLSSDRLAHLSCDSGEMILRLNFSEPFRGIVYPDHNRLSPCRFFGDGHHNYELRLPLRGCGTRQVSQRVFVNDIVVRFHKTLELEEDEVKTLVCRYQPPQTISASSGNSAAHDQFELVDPTSGRPAAGSDTLELEAAPPGGERQRQQQLSFAHQLRDLSAANGLANETARQLAKLAARPGAQTPFGDETLLLPQADLKSPFDLAGLEDATVAPPARNATQPAARPTGVELLFLISSVLFLVLLALCLAGALFWLRRRRQRRNRRRPPGHVEAILANRKHQGHYPTTSAALIQAATRHGGGGGAAAQRHYWRPGGNSQLYARQHVASAATAAHLQQPVSSSSPESDVSNQVLLPAAAGRRGGQLVAGRRQLDRLAASNGGGHAHQLLGRRGEYSSAAHLYPPAGATFAGRKLAAREPLLVGNAARQTSRGRRLQTAADATFEPTLIRTKSMQQVPPTGSQIEFNRRANLDANFAAAATLNKTGGRWLERGEFAVQPPQRTRQLDASAVEGPDSLGPPQAFPGRKMRATHHYDDDQASSRRRHTPRIVLKSIEDSYITNVTETYEQEYVETNSTRPLSLAEWRAKASQSSPSARKLRDGAESPPGEDSAKLDASASPRNSAESRGGRQEETANKMRSLTELDVDFAKLISNSSKTSLPKQVGPKPRTAKEDGGDELVVSADYDEEDRRLKLGGASSASPSAKSVSYV